MLQYSNLYLPPFHAKWWLKAPCLLSPVSQNVSPVIHLLQHSFMQSSYSILLYLNYYSYYQLPYPAIPKSKFYSALNKLREPCSWCTQQYFHIYRLCETLWVNKISELSTVMGYVSIQIFQNGNSHSNLLIQKPTSAALPWPALSAQELPLSLNLPMLPKDLPDSNVF